MEKAKKAKRIASRKQTSSMEVMGKSGIIKKNKKESMPISSTRTYNL